jgi:hypothetical protein
MRALVGMLFVAALAGPTAACPPEAPPPPRVGWAPVATVRPPAPPAREGTSLLVFGVTASSMLSSLVLFEKLRRRRHATASDPLPPARVVRR